MYNTFTRNLMDNWRGFDELFKEFEEYFAPLHRIGHGGDVQTRDEDHATLTLALPGVDPKDIEVEVNENIVTITAEANAPDVDGTLVLDEFSSTKTRRSYRLGFRPDPKKIKATSKDGILTVELERASADKPKKINVLAA